MESAKIIAVLALMLRDVGQAEELAQEASRATLIRRGSGGEVVAGVAEAESAALLKDFFAGRR